MAEQQQLLCSWISSQPFVPCASDAPPPSKRSALIAKLRDSAAAKALQLVSGVVGVALLFLVPAELLVDTAALVAEDNTSTAIRCGDGVKLMAQSLLSERYSGQRVTVFGVVAVLLCCAVALSWLRCFTAVSVARVQSMFEWWRPMLRQCGELFFQACVCVHFTRGVAHPAPMLVWATVILLDAVLT